MPAIAVKAPSRRPVLFVFNGGPGGASAPANIGAMGPRTLVSLDNAALADPSIALTDNPQSLLDTADLVFIDPTDTGFSHTLPGTPAKQFRSIDGDSDMVTQVIALWLKDHSRMASPKYIFGESYGTMRAVAVARDLARSPAKIDVDGLILGGFAITYGQGGRLPDLGRAANQIVMMASVAWHYGKIDNKSQTWQQAVDKARHFARTDYISALVQGYRLDPAERERIITQLPAITGIPESYFRANNSLIVRNFNAELLRDENLQVDRNNGLNTEVLGTTPDRDFAKAFMGLNSAMKRYTRTELKAPNLGDYDMLTRDYAKVFGEWNFFTTGAPSLDVTMASEFRRNPKLHLLVAQGRYDTLTNMGTTEYTLSQTDIPADRYSIAYFDGGHMLLPTPEIMSAIRSFLVAR